VHAIRKAFSTGRLRPGDGLEKYCSDAPSHGRKHDTASVGKSAPQSPSRRRGKTKGEYRVNMHMLEPYVSLVGRLLLAAIFVLSGINKAMNPEGTQQFMASQGITWMTGFFYFGTVLVEVGAGLGLVLGYWTRIASGVLFMFMIPATLIFHTHLADPNQMIHFMKNLAMMGGLLYVLAYGPGPISLDARQRT
jgi:putative oxidoreductase